MDSGLLFQNRKISVPFELMELRIFTPGIPLPKKSQKECNLSKERSTAILKSFNVSQNLTSQIINFHEKKLNNFACRSTDTFLNYSKMLTSSNHFIHLNRYFVIMDDLDPHSVLTWYAT